MSNNASSYKIRDGASRITISGLRDRELCLDIREEERERTLVDWIYEGKILLLGETLSFYFSDALSLDARRRFIEPSNPPLSNRLASSRARLF